jgi:metal-responsive CopG/Arc/MetJ family transcriptional regulator
MSRRRFEVLIDDQTVRELADIAFQAGTTRSHLVRKAVRLYLANRKPRTTNPDDRALP